MLALMHVAFWIGAGLVGYAYAGYALCVWVLARLRPRLAHTADITPMVSLIIPCYNEAAYIAAKLENSLASDYSPEHLEVLVITSGPDDGTEEIVARYGARGVWCITQAVRAGKEVAMQEAAREARGEILVFTDANAMLNPGAIRAMVRWFADPHVGCVSGEKRVRAALGEGSGGGEGAYWRYESSLKRLDSRVGSTMGAVGELIAIRANLMSFQETDNIIEDFVLSMRIVEAGYRVVYEPTAVATEDASVRMGDLFERRARIAAGGLQALWRLRSLLNPRRGLVWWQYVSHRVLRWALVPLLLPTLVITNLVLRRAHLLYRTTLAVQVAFYFAAVVGWRWQGARLGKLFLFYYPYFFCTVNVAPLAGFLRLVTGRQTVLWKRTRP